MGSTIQEDEGFCQTVCYPTCLPTCDKLCPNLCSSPPVEYDFPQSPPHQWYDNEGDGSMSSAGIALICVLTFFFLGFGSCVIKRCGDGTESSTLTSHQDENQEASARNPPRMIALSSGLPLHIIDSIKTQKYTGKNSSAGNTDCSVCLADFEEDDLLKLLPRCNHPFHIQCINKWLMSHTNCPLCRATVAFDQNYNTKVGEIQIPGDHSDQGINMLQNREAVGLSNNTEEPDGGEATSVYIHSDHIQKISDGQDLMSHEDSSSSSSK